MLNIAVPAGADGGLLAMVDEIIRLQTVAKSINETRAWPPLVSATERECFVQRTEMFSRENNIAIEHFYYVCGDCLKSPRRSAH